MSHSHSSPDQVYTKPRGHVLVNSNNSKLKFNRELKLKFPNKLRETGCSLKRGHQYTTFLHAHRLEGTQAGLKSITTLSGNIHNTLHKHYVDGIRTSTFKPTTLSEVN